MTNNMKIGTLEILLKITFLCNYPVKKVVFDQKNKHNFEIIVKYAK